MMFITKDSYPQSKYNIYYEICEDIHTFGNIYRIGERIGVGGNAAVYECSDQKGDIWAIKFLLSISEKSCKRFVQEIKILQKLNHPHIIKCIDQGRVSAKAGKNSQNVSIPFVILEKADMNVVEYMRKSDCIEYGIYAPQIRGLSDALIHLHKYAVHRDIKPENILVRGETWLLGDFGLCTVVEDEERMDLTKPQERIGPKYWLSPEATDKVYFGTNDIDETSDVYQMCAVFWFIITRRYPLGIIEEDDYADFDTIVCGEILRSLKYNREKRANTSKALYDAICNATINRGV